MLLAVLADIHANLVALEAALRLVEDRGASALYCLGDVVGYGPEPGRCVDLVRAHFDGCVLGNHDEAVATGEGLRALPPDGQKAAAAHRAQLSQPQLDWLQALPLLAEAHGCTFVHASPSEPQAWARLNSYTALQAQFAAFGTALCFVGHSHSPAVVSDKLGVHRVRPGARFLINPGSVGQPRDHDPRLALGLLDTDTLAYELVRAHYDVERTVAQIAAAGLPPALGERLRRGV